MIEAVIFDLDGTLLNSLEDLCDSVNFVMKQEGYPTRTLEEVRTFVGTGVYNLIRYSLPEGTSKDEIMRVTDIYKEHYSKNMRNKTRPYDGIIPMLKTLKEHKIDIGVSSNKYDTAVKELCSQMFWGLVDVAVGECKTVAKKPDPQGVFVAISNLEKTPENTVYVGDSEVDIKTAQNAGIRCISVTWGFRDKEFLLQNGAQTICDTPEELVKIILEK